MFRLLAAGADINVVNDKGETALDAAIEQGYEYLALELLNRGAAPDQPNHEGNTPWDYAVFYEHPEIRAALEKAGAMRQTRTSASELKQRDIDVAFHQSNAVKNLIRLIGRKFKEEAAGIPGPRFSLGCRAGAGWPIAAATSP